MTIDHIHFFISAILELETVKNSNIGSTEQSTKNLDSKRET